LNNVPQKRKKQKNTNNTNKNVEITIDNKKEKRIVYGLKNKAEIKRNKNRD
jgi:hypothetical protein